MLGQTDVVYKGCIFVSAAVTLEPFLSDDLWNHHDLCLAVRNTLFSDGPEAFPIRSIM